MTAHAAQRRPVAVFSEVPRIGYTRSEAAEIIGIGTDLFDRAVVEGRMPQPRLLGGRLLWDIDELIKAFRELPHRDPSNPNQNAQSSADPDLK